MRHAARQSGSRFTTRAPAAGSVRDGQQYRPAANEFRPNWAYVSRSPLCAAPLHHEGLPAAGYRGGGQPDFCHSIAGDLGQRDHRVRLGFQEVWRLDQDLMTQWHARYQGPGVMIYWHVERRAACVYSPLKTCSSSEVAAMIEGVLRHCT